MGVPNANWTMTNLNKDYQVRYMSLIFLVLSDQYRHLIDKRRGGGVGGGSFFMFSISKFDLFYFLLQLCDTYPQCLFVPTSVSTIVLVGSASFRSKGRLPVLTYLHKNQVCLSASLFGYVTNVIDYIYRFSIAFPRRHCAGAVSLYPDSARDASKTSNY